HEVALRREYQHWQPVASGPEIPQDVESGQARQHDVQHEQVRPKGRESRQRLVTMADDPNFVAFVSEVVGEPARQGRLIFDQKQTGARDRRALFFVPFEALLKSLEVLLQNTCVAVAPGPLLLQAAADDAVEFSGQLRPQFSQWPRLGL